MKRNLLFFIFLFSSIFLSAQNFKAIYKSMSSKDKFWAVGHYNSVMTAINISKDVMKTMDSLDNEKFLGGNSEGGKFDAFRHIYWMYSLSSEIGEENARRIGEIYENYNYYVFTQRPLSGYDSVGMAMDLFNNDLGIGLSKTIEDKSFVFKEIENIIIQGKAKVIKKNQNSESLDINGDIIPKEEWKSSWVNRRVLVNSDE